ncbi:MULTISPECIES: undecaprenyl-diphosphatase [unclassified Paenibacillus]|uniref:undecaprenyl-diphosphatase n=1 Tax=unclassified Paenibacillus TaxID=185978 RepID=UPI0009561210|nr:MULTISPECIES: undecaprenyl-diphosphatase [unclassified Paenibacillus]ASS68673.1 undecaprenyl-diphosphatase [Paenibacillus sp. RUD330]SIR55499.1 undecaprenyl-diphosphatase [Paenibacillus sp. RU4X]SIR63985.1 undecaprenyl-diphosphatase [Paenibacillus sp. RU4T]
MNEQIFEIVNGWAGRYAWLDSLMVFCAEYLVFVMLGILALLWLTGRERNQKTVFQAGLAAGLALLVGMLLISPAVNHPRPFAASEHVHQLVAHAADASFPSDHSTLAFALAASVLFAKRRTGLLLLAMALMTGLGRVFVGVHYPADIAGAAVLSLLAALAAHVLRNRIDALSAPFIRLSRRLMRSTATPLPAEEGKKLSS